MEQLNEEEHEHEEDQTGEGQREYWAWFLWLWREVVRDCLVKLVVIAHSKIRSLLRSLVEVDLKCSEILDDGRLGSWVINVNK